MWDWEYPTLEYVFYGLATIAIWTIVNLFIKLTDECDLEDMDEMEQTFERETPIREETEGRGIPQDYATRVNDGIPSGDASSFEEEPEREEVGVEPSPGVDSESEGQDDPFRVEQAQRIDAEDREEESFDLEEAKPEWHGKDVERGGPVDSSDVRREVEIQGEDPTNLDSEMNVEEVEEDASNFDSLMTWKELEANTEHENSLEESDDSSGFEITMIDPHSVELEPISEDEGSDDPGETLSQKQWSAGEVNDNSEAANHSTRHDEEEHGDCRNWTEGDLLPKINTSDESSQRQHELPAEEFLVLDENEIPCASEGEEEQENLSAKLDYLVVEDNDVGVGHCSLGESGVDSEEEIGKSEEKEREDTGEAQEKNIPHNECNYAREEEEVIIDEEQTYPIAEGSKIQGEPFEEEGYAVLEEDSINIGEPEDGALETSQIHSEGKGENISEGVVLIAHGQCDRPRLGLGEEEAKEEREIDCSNSGGSVRDERATGSGKSVGDESGGDHPRLESDQEESIVAINEVGEVEFADGLPRHEEASGSGGTLEVSRVEAVDVRGGADGHVVRRNSDQASQTPDVENATFIGHEGADSSAADAEISDKDLSLSGRSNDKESNAQVCVEKIQKDVDDIAPGEQSNILSPLHEGFDNEYWKPVVKITRPIDPQILGTLGFFSYEERNLLKNNCGQEEFSHWTLKQDNHGWSVGECSQSGESLPTKNPYGDPLPEFDGHSTYFETVNRMCKKEQTIDLIAEGFDAEYLDTHEPNIEIGEWVSTRVDCKSTYELRVRLLNEKKMTISDFQLDHSFSNTKEATWKKVSHVFKKYGAGVRYVFFSHGAVKWFGKNGCRMTGGVVKIVPKRSK